MYSCSNTRDTEDFYHRTVTSYITTRISQSAVIDSFFVGDFDEAVPKNSGDTFFFTEHFGDITYVTRLYCYEGALYELFSPLSAELDPSTGERILPLSSLDFTLEDGLLISDIVFEDDNSVTLRLSLRTEENTK